MLSFSLMVSAHQAKCHDQVVIPIASGNVVLITKGFLQIIIILFTPNCQELMNSVGNK
jgi:hypothetical protein